MILSYIDGPTPVIHIGMPKTATKTLQWRVFAKHSDIFYLGRYDGPSFGKKHRIFKACRDEQVLQIMDEIAYDGISQPDIPKCRRLMVEYLEANNRQQLIPVWSWESYSTDSRKNRGLRAKNLKDLFGTARILVTIRNPVKLLESAFLQQLKRDNIGSGYRRGNGVFHCSIEHWLERDRSSDITNHLDYPKTIQMYTEQFGVENVCVLTFEHLLQDKIAFFTKLCNFMRINLEETLATIGTNVDNSRWTETQLERLQEIKKSHARSWQFRCAQRPHRREMLDLDKKGVPRSLNSSATAPIPADWQKKIAARTETGNLWLEQVFDLDLSELGYMGK